MSTEREVNKKQYDFLIQQSDALLMEDGEIQKGKMIKLKLRQRLFQWLT